MVGITYTIAMKIFILRPAVRVGTQSILWSNMSLGALLMAPRIMRLSFKSRQIEYVQFVIKPLIFVTEHNESMLFLLFVCFTSDHQTYAAY